MNAISKDTPRSMQFAYRELLTPGMAVASGAVAAFLLAHYTILGPLGTSGTMNWVERLGFWAAVGVLQYPVCYASGALTLYIVRNRPKVQIWMALIVMVLLLSASCSAIVITIHGLFSAGRWPEIPLPKLYGLCALNLFSAVALLYYVFCVRLSVRPGAAAATADSLPTDSDARSVAALPVVEPAAEESTAAPAAPLPTAPPQEAGAAADGRAGAQAASRFFDRLPDEIGRDIIYLSAAAHYVDVITADGSASILLRFSDAVSELGELGIRVHRSYWVAYGHVKQAFRRDGRTMLRLTGEHEVRVGRNFLPEVRAAVPKAWIRARRRVVHGAAPTSNTTS